MVLVTLAIFSKIFYPDQLKQFKKQLINKSSNRDTYRKGVLLNIIWFSVILVLFLLNVVPGVLIASECSNGNICNIILGFLFSDIYVFHYVLRKFVYKDNYCKV